MAKPLEPTKRSRREERNRKDDRNYEMFLKAVNAAPPAEQVSVASHKYLAMLEENKKMQFYIKQLDKHHAIIQKEKEQLQLEFNKTVLLKSKLENLCRELQKQNKCIKVGELLFISYHPLQGWRSGKYRCWMHKAEVRALWHSLAETLSSSVGRLVNAVEVLKNRRKLLAVRW